MGKLSPEAARLKYEYNKKYQERYWEKKAAEKHTGPRTREEESGGAVSRGGMSDEQYIAALEKSNRTLNSENRRLVKLVHNYQSMIVQSLTQAQ